MIQSFLQSDAWERFQKSLGRKTWRVDGALIIQHDVPYGFNYLYSPWPEVDGVFFEKIANIAKKQKSIFLKIDSPYELRISANYKYRKSESIQPQKTTVVNLTRSEEGLLAAMHEKTRYNIRLAERKGVIVFSNRELEQFLDLLQETAERDGFHTHERGYYEKLLQTQSQNFSNELFFADYSGQVVAAAMINFYRSPTSIVATYLHGASSREHREVMAPHLLHWRIIQEAKKRGFQKYDFWGIDEKKWPGLTRFKMGFGGDVMGCLKTVDIVYRPLVYRAYRLLKTLR